MSEDRTVRWYPKIQDDERRALLDVIYRVSDEASFSEDEMLIGLTVVIGQIVQRRVVHGEQGPERFVPTRLDAPPIKLPWS